MRSQFRRVRWLRRRSARRQCLVAWVRNALTAVPLLARGERIPVGGTIRAIGHRWHSVFIIPATACARHMVIVGATSSENPTHEISDMGCWQAR